MMRSIQRTLLAWVLGALAFGSAAVALTSYLLTLQEMGEVFDTDLRNVAQAVSGYHGSVDPRPDPAPKTPDTEDGDAAADAAILTQTWAPDGQRRYRSDASVALPITRAEGLSTLRVGDEDWIVYTRVTARGIVQAAQRRTTREALAAEAASKVLLPLALLSLGVGGLLVFSLRRGLRPLDRAARDVAARSETALAPIATDAVPREIEPLVSSINGLMARLAGALAAQRRFVADAAHELRTPITALRLQLQRLRRSGDASAREQALAELEAGIARSQRLVEQLLQVARAEPDGRPQRRVRVDLAALVRETVGRHSQRAEALGIDLGALADAEVWLDGDADPLGVLLDNLVENAIRYTPAGGTVDVAATLDQGAPLLSVRDNGPGIPAAERERVFDRFYRGEDAHALARDASGSGLGLAIVKAIAERHGAAVSLHTPAGGRGLEVQVRFARAGATGT
jgi:two-component system, OmpR family, sensor kinase